MSQRTAPEGVTTAPVGVVTTRKSRARPIRGRDPGRPARSEAGHPTQSEIEPAGFEGGEGCSSSRSRDGTTPARRRPARRSILRDQLGLVEIAAVDPEHYFDYQFTRPRSWSTTTAIAAPRVAERRDPRTGQLRHLATGHGARHPTARAASAPSRRAAGRASPPSSWMPRSRPTSTASCCSAPCSPTSRTPARISVFASSENREVRDRARLDRSSYEGPVGHPQRARRRRPSAPASPPCRSGRRCPTTCTTRRRPKAMLALLGRLEDLTGLEVPRGNLETEAGRGRPASTRSRPTTRTWRDTSRQLEQARDTVDSPEASGEAIAQEFERYLRRRGGGPRAAPTGARVPATSPGGRATAPEPADAVAASAHADVPVASSAKMRAAEQRRGRSRTAGSCAS